MSSNVISLSRHQSAKVTDISALSQNFAKMRKDPNDVFWLKENAEFLNILECTGAAAHQTDVEVYSEFYQDLPNRMAFFPQYYRFFLSIACDLEALGIEGHHAQQLCDFAKAKRLPNSELSDLQRAEAMRLLARRGITSPDENELISRLHKFINNSPGFALPNHKAAYELTHIVFYLSEYGRVDPKLSAAAIQSLMYVGILAHLEQNADLLAEVCIALRYAKEIPPIAWEDWIYSVTKHYEIRDYDAGYADTYHEFLVCNWASAQMNREAFSQSFHAHGLSFFSPISPLGTLGQISENLLTWQEPRLAKWDLMERRLFAALPDAHAQHLADVVNATPFFDAFFEHFVRPAPANFGRNEVLTIPMLDTAQ